MIDVIIPAYNAHNTIERALISILNQSIKNKLKIYIINDCPDNDYLNIIEKFKNELDITEYRLDKNHGPGYARQYGLNHSSNERIVFLDADDVYFSYNSIEQLNKKMDETNCDMVFSKIYELVDNHYCLYENDWIDVQGKLYKRAYINEHGITFPYLYGEEDNSFNQQFYAYSPYIEKIEDTTYVRLPYQESLTRSSSNDYYSKYEYYYSSGFLHTLQNLIKNKAYEGTIINIAFSTIVRLYNRIENVNKGNIVDRRTISNLKKIIEIYDNYSDYLQEDEKRNIINNEDFPPFDKYEYLTEDKIKLYDFIDKYR